MERNSRSRGLTLAGVLALVVALDLHACSLTPFAPAPLAPAATVALAEARSLQRANEPPELVRAAAERARRDAPDWVAPERVLDDLARGDLIAHGRLAERLAELRETDASADRKTEAGRLARELYLVGRLEGSLGAPRFGAALELDQELAWAHHGQGWMLFNEGSPSAALRPARRARELARDDWERVNFALAEARYLLALERLEDAAELLGEVEREAPALAPGDRAELVSLRARAELASDEPALADRGFWRAIDALRTAELTEAEVQDLAEALLERRGGSAPGPIEEIESALGARRSPARDRLRAGLLLERGDATLAFGLLTGEPLVETPTVRAGRIAAGEARVAIEDWFAALPAQVLGPDGLPARSELADVVRAARGDDDELLADVLLAAGWFEEARALASQLAARDLAFALELHERATAGRSLLGGVRRLLEQVDARGDYAGPAAVRSTQGRETESGRDPAPIESLDQLLAAMQPLFERHRPGADSLVDSPRVRYGRMAVVVQPGPVLTEADEAAGLGVAGEEVGGLGGELLALGRFGIFGQSLGGGGPDGTVLRLLAFEERAGEHLGVPYGGTVAWCEGVDVPSRPVRRGANITGAALHEGYWIDVAGVRSEATRWRLLEEAFLGSEADRARAERALAAEGPALEQGISEKLRASSRTSLYAPLGEADRLRLAVLLERPERAGGRVTLEELLEVTARHEEGHLTDRSRFLPISENLFAALGLFADAGFSPSGLARLLELRAQLVCLCVAEDPRLPLAECLDGVEGGPGVTPHASAYRVLVAELLDVFEERRSAGELELDGERYLVHQLHGLQPEEIRSAALELARRKGMVRD